MADEIGDGSYGYVNHMGRYVLGQVALHTGNAEGLAQARRTGERLHGTPSCPSSRDLGAWLLAQVADAEGDAATAVLAGTSGVAVVLHNTAPAGDGAGLDQYLVSTLNVSGGQVDRIESFLSEPAKIADYFGR
jgi:hypothetical protein